MNLTETDLTILIEALDAWVEKDTAGGLVVDLLGAMLSGKDPESQAQIRRGREQSHAKAEYEKGQRKEVATLLKASLIRMRRDLQADGRGLVTR